MGQPAVVQGDTVTGTCPTHQIPNPGTGSPQPAGPLQFEATLTTGLATTVRIAGKPAAVEGSGGTNGIAHPPLHSTDTKPSPSDHTAEITGGSSTVTIEGKAAAYAGCTATACIVPTPMVTGSAQTVTIGA